mmetsp:Transcript_49917/g.118316  ORF Transcript_49917/g.118316 Transcript_49917/m.118316 type:complete len:443 (+) Transcript_49917:293-1621(+)
MATVDFVTKAIDLVQKAVETDKAATGMTDPDKQREKYQEAMNQYIHAIDVFQTAIKYEKVPNRLAMLKNKMIEYMERAEKIKSILNEPVKKKAAADGDDKEGKDKTKMRDSLKATIMTEKPNIKWDDVAGLESAKEALKEAVILPIKFPQLFAGGGRTPWSGIMLYGPPGTGKSFLAKAVASESDATFLSVSSADLTSKWLGESEKLVKTLFQTAREEKPAIIFIDEIDSIATVRSDSESESSRRIKTELLVQMDGLGNSLDGLLVLAATNLPWAIDTAVRRRCQKRIYIPLPDDRARKRMFEIKLNKIAPPADITGEQLEILTQRTEGYSGSDITVVFRDAIMEPVRRCQDAQAFKWVDVAVPDSETGETEKRLMPCSPGFDGCIEMNIMTLAKEYGPEKLVAPPVTFRDFEKTLQRCRPSVSEDDLAEFEKFTKEFGQDG